MPALNVEICQTMDDTTTKAHEMKEKPPIKAAKGVEKLAGLYDSDEEVEVNPSGLPCNFLVTNNEPQVQRYVEYLRSRLTEGEGETLVEIGVPILNGGKETGLTEQEMEKALAKNQEILSSLKAVGTRILNRKKGNKVTEVWMVRKAPEEQDFIEVRVAVVGNVDAGKSTLLGVLTHSALDDGRGAARQKLFRHKHEFETGRTSSVGNDILGFDVHGNIVNKPNPHNHNLDWVQISRDSAKLVTFIDLAGHEKYLKTTIFGMTGHMPDYTMLMIGANMGVIGTTKEHLSLALSLTVPVYIVVTKIDWCPPQVLEETLKNIGRLVKSARKIPVMVRSMDDVIHAATHFPSNRVCPIFQVSNVMGTNLDLLRQFMNVVPLRRVICETDPAHFQIDDVYWVEGVGTVVSGTCISGTIKINDNLVMGPSSVSEWLPLQIKSIHRKRMPVDIVRCGQTASFAFRTQVQKKITKKDVRKGMVMLDQKNMPDAGLTFEADILILHHPTTIKPNYQAMLHIGSIRQTATLVKMSKDVLRTGDRDRVTFKFIKYPEFIRPGTKMVFREGRTKAVGTVVGIVQGDDLSRARQKDKYNRMMAKRGPKPPNNKPKDDAKVNELADKMNNL